MNKGYLLLFELIKDIRKTYDKSKKDTLLEEKKVTLKENEEKEKADIKSIYDKIKNINLNDFKKILQHYIKLTK
ncbi:MAG: hypothetical protein P1U46_04255 [Patescibacteria group bacterium]|nr:hypothetical protein [Patescibacteria group bacterium]